MFSLAPPMAPRPQATYRTDLVTAILSTWFTIGLFLDAWAHNNIPELETFFTPWHAAFYTGFAATGGWVAWTCRDFFQSRGEQGHPAGYGLAMVAGVGFAVAGVGDLIWHTVFGIEQNINILFSPTHLGLGLTMLIIVTTPVRSAQAFLPFDPGLRRLTPAIIGTALGTTLVLLFLQYANALVYRSTGVVVALSTVGHDEFTAPFVSAMAVTTVVLLVPVLTIARRWRIPPGTTTIVYAAAGALSAAVTGLENLELIGGLVVAGVAADVLAWRLRPTPDRPVQFRAFGALVPLITWSVIIAVAYIATPGLHEPPELGGAPLTAVPELVTGVPVAQALIGWLVAVIIAPRAATRGASAAPVTSATAVDEPTAVKVA